MNPHHVPFLIAAYSVFIVVLLWDFVAARWQIRKALRDARQRRERQQRQRGKATPSDAELSR